MSIYAEVTRADLPIIKRWIEEGDNDRAGKTLTMYLSEHPDDIDAWFLFGTLMLHMENIAVARIIYEWTTSTEKGASMWQHWWHLGKAYDNLLMAEKAEEIYRQALSLDPANTRIMTSLATNLVMQYRSEESRDMCQHVLKTDSSMRMARSTLGFAYLQLRDWANGWTCYEAGYGKLKGRKERIYGDGEGLWNGTPGQRIVVHGEQGIGDQIAGLEPLADVCKQAEVLAVEVDAKLAGLVARSYPGLEVHDTLQETGLDWPGTLGQIDAHAGFFTLHRHMRRSESDYLGRPYLVADPARRIQWRALLDSLGPEPKVGLAWSGGVPLTQRLTRRADLSTWLPILNQNCHWIGLEYRDRSEDIEQLERLRGIKVHDWPWGPRSKDYDDVAALVAELDAVVTVPTSVVHLAGALGTPTLCMVHDRPNIHYNGVGSTIAYYGDTVRLYRRGAGEDWAASVAAVAKDLAGMVGEREAA